MSEEAKVADVVKTLGAAIDKTDMQWVQFTDEETFAGMVGAGMSKAIAGVYVEMGNAINSGVLFEDFKLHEPHNLGDTKLADFAEDFAAVYKLQG